MFCIDRHKINLPTALPGKSQAGLMTAFAKAPVFFPDRRYEKAPSGKPDGARSFAFCCQPAVTGESDMTPKRLKNL
jgi:hypothetical protein